MRVILIGKKVGMTQVFDAEGNRVPVTVVHVGPCVVTQIKNPEKDGYAAIQVAYAEKKQQRATKSEIGRFKKANTTPKKYLKEFRVDAKDLDKFEVGMTLTCDVFKPGDLVDVMGTSRGMGFQGVMKRYHFRGFRATHGTHENFRTPGSVGMRTWPGRVLRGKRFPGHMGDDHVTVQNVKVIDVMLKDNAMLIRGSLPGHRKAVVSVRMAIKKKAPENRVPAKA